MADMPVNQVDQLVRALVRVLKTTPFGEAVGQDTPASGLARHDVVVTRTPESAAMLAAAAIGAPNVFATIDQAVGAAGAWLGAGLRVGCCQISKVAAAGAARGCTSHAGWGLKRGGKDIALGLGTAVWPFARFNEISRNFFQISV